MSTRFFVKPTYRNNCDISIKFNALKCFELLILNSYMEQNWVVKSSGVSTFKIRPKDLVRRKQFFELPLKFHDEN